MKSLAVPICFVWLPLAALLLPPTAAAQSSIRLDDFSSHYPAQTPPENWEKKTVKPFATSKGEQFQFVHRDSDHYIRMATGPKNFFSLAPKATFQPAQFPLIRWEWLVKSFPEDTEAYQSQRRDKAASLCLFDNPQSRKAYRAVCYVWELDGPKNTPFIPPYNKRTAFISLRTRKDDKPQRWNTEQRNLLQDFQRIWGKTPTKGQITIFVDSDTSKSRAEALFRNIILFKAS